MIKVGLERLLIQGAAKFEAISDADAIDLLVIEDTIAIYSKLVGDLSTLWYKDDAQVEHQITAGGGGGGGGGADGCCELLVADGVCGPPEILTTEDGCDFLYEG